MGNMKMFKYVVFFTLISLLSGCAVRMIDFTVISSKKHSLQFDKSKGVNAEGKSMGFMGMGATIKDAMDDALAKAGPNYDLLIDGVVYSQIYPFVRGFKVTGVAVSSSDLRAYLGENGFLEWLGQNNVFDPTTAVVQK